MRQKPGKKLHIDIEKKKECLDIIKTKYRSKMKTISGEWTFVGVLAECFIPTGQIGFPCITDNWIGSTTEKCTNDYVFRLLDRLPLHKAVPDIKLEEYYEAVDGIVSEKYPDPLLHTGNENASDYARHYLHLTRIVLSAAAWLGIDLSLVIWGTNLSKPRVQTENIRSQQLLSIPKCLSTRETIEFCARLTEDIANAPGQDLGLLIMMLAGCRNEEAVALTFGDVFELSNYPGSWNSMVYGSGTRVRDEMKAGSKTKHAYRYLMIVSYLHDLIAMRFNAIKDKIATGECDGIDDPLKLPIACFGSEVDRCCITNDLTMRAKHHFREMKYPAESLVALDLEMSQDRNSYHLVQEKEPTAYLLRRQCATMNSLLGLTEAEQQYILGHKITNHKVRGRDFSNEDLRYVILKKMEAHPICEMVRLYGKDVLHNSQVIDVIGKDIEEASHTKVAKPRCEIESPRVQMLVERSEILKLARGKEINEVEIMYKDYKAELIRFHSQAKQSG